ncbi:MAG TPA: sulfite dehydrogenase [Sulfurovum sp.]|jgi:sulfane dehydrogenase subunit SoxC|nr:MAG: sulfite dehydrogenase [Sulfurovum sp. 35-42-20]OYY54611.1 MAG: sulfite dehydrogenase [Sulfurovum sp. 28-43-6]OYZ26392.1 MAG: sulfite dehydrogenase [Sulfurovum sp. 16-42-52]OYZ49785.1 MAG: sulfite dehydrogenase [Sulfurovum sp. 24-42-9]OZA46406.1 MAG: sulfite dehydrogenase [Sulfurovum sp. 17-42-90]OZA60146.1 MAG: sulfite dehydrogenase [Sulfurovum sp. 39-42-12]HQR74582.1 sulfite dehydrogenase [Sulfurovum sp.]
MNKISKEELDVISEVVSEQESRRNFFKKTATYSMGALAAASVVAPVMLSANEHIKANAEDDPNIMEEKPWATKWGAGVDEGLYGMPSPYEHNVTRRITPILASGNTRASIAVTPIQDLSGIIVPNGLFFNRNHGGTPTINPNEHRLMIHGLVEKPIVLTMEQLKRYPSVSRIHFLECPANGGPEWRGPQFNSIQFAKGFMSCAEWTGVYLKDIIKDLGLKPEAQWMLAEGNDSSHMGRTIPVDKVLDDVMIVWGQNGEALRPEQGYPIRIVVPGWEANLCVKWLARLEFSAEPYYAKEETSKYTALKHTGKAIQHFYVNEVNSVITSPCPEKPWTDLKKGDMVEIEGLAWSGFGTITTVDVSFDGGKNWTEASLKGLVIEKAWTRFSIMHEYTGKPMLLSSRAADDAGHIQPSVKNERAAVGIEGVYHRNGIHTWEIDAKGVVTNVQILS